MQSLLSYVWRTRRAISVLVLLAAAGAGRVHAGDYEVVVRDQAGAPLQNVVVALYAEDSSVGSGPDGDPPRAVMDQKQMQFVPRVLVVRVGARVSFPNSDRMRHHVYSFSPAKRFELKLYAGEPAEPVTFDQSGTVVLGCNIHDAMVGHIYVVETPFFAVTDAEGRARLDGLATGRYRVDLQHPAQKDARPANHVEIASGRTAQGTFDIEVERMPTATRELSPLEKRFKRGLRP